MMLAREVEPQHLAALPEGGTRWILTQTALIVAAIGVYFGVRGLTVGAVDLAETHARTIVEIERNLGIGFESTVQRPFEDPGVLQTLANWVYIWGHWPVIVATMIWLAFRHTAILLRLRDAMIVSGAMGMVVFASFLFLVSNGALEWGPLKRERPVATEGMVSPTRTTTSTIRRVGLEGRADAEEAA